MSLLSVVEQAIKSRKDEQANINSSIQRYREILQALTPQPKTASVESVSADDAVRDTDASPGEKEDIELLERVLEKALRVRTGTGPLKKDANKQSAPQREPSTAGVTPKEASAASKCSQASAKLTARSVSLDRKGHKRPGTSVSSTLGSKSSASYNPGKSKTTINRNIIQTDPVSSTGILHRQAARKSQQAVSVSGSPDPAQLHTSTLQSKNKTIRSSVLSGNDLGAAIATTSSNNTAPVSQAEECEAQSLPQQHGVTSDQIATWKSLRRKQSRLWDKAAALQRKPVPGRSHFMERIRSTFPKDWPRGSPDQTRALVDILTRQGLDLTQRCRTEELLAKQTPEAETEQGAETLDRLQMAVAELQTFARQVKQEWEAWDRWRPEGGCLCPTGADAMWVDGMIAPVPPTITYTSEAELRELESLRMRVALLQQEIQLEQAVSHTLSPRLSSVLPGPGCPSASLLRDVYSLLGEGGQRFPAIVLDSESN